MPFWCTYYHVVWATKHRTLLITSDLEPELYRFVCAKVETLGGNVYAIGSVEDHIHTVVSIPPKLAVADFVGQVKGASAFHVNHLPNASGAFSWQRGYGVITVGPSGLEAAISYVHRQKEHHRQGTTIAALERTDETDESIHRPGTQAADGR